MFTQTSHCCCYNTLFCVESKCVCAPLLTAYCSPTPVTLVLSAVKWNPLLQQKLQRKWTPSLTGSDPYLTFFSFFILDDIFPSETKQRLICCQIQLFQWNEAIAFKHINHINTRIPLQKAIQPKENHKHTFITFLMTYIFNEIL